VITADCFPALLLLLLRRFLIPLGIALGADLTFSQFIFQNLIPVTLGNIVGGLVFMVSC
jgi:formate/nitrite transporter FocA (FNT family)